MIVKVPENLSEITIDKFIKYNRIMNLSDIDDEKKMIFIVSLFCDVEVSKIGILEIGKVKAISNQLISILSLEPREIFEFDNFGFIPNLDTITTAEYIDIDNYGYDIELANKFMAVLFRPITKKINGLRQIEDYEGSDKYSEKMLQAPLEAYLSAKVFFWNLSKDLLKATRVALEQKNQQVRLLEVALEKNGSGMIQFTQLLEKASLILEKQLNYQYTSF